MERIKTMIIIGLFAMSVFLSSQVLYTMKPIIGEEQATPVVSSFVLSNFILPESMILHFSKDSHTILSPTKAPSIWEAGQTRMKTMLESDETGIEPILWDEVQERKSERSVDYVFSSEFDLDLLLRIYGIAPEGSLELPETVTGIWISAENGDLVFYHDQEAVRLNSAIAPSNLTALLREANEADYIHYYPGVLLNDQAEFYLPITLGDVLPNVRVQSAVDVDDAASLERIAKGFFEENFDYARRIVESDYTTIFVQGNDTLVISEDGLLEYTNTQPVWVDDPSLYESLHAAGRFISERDEIGAPVYLTGVETGDDNDFRFSFSYFINDTPVRLKHEMEESLNLKSPIEVYVKYNTVKTYRRILRFVEPSVQPLPQDTFSPQDVIDRNFDTIVSRYQGSLRARGEEEPADYGVAIYQSIEDVKLAYFDFPDKQIDGEMELLAIWEILIDDYYYYFDVHTGHLVDIAQREE